MHRLPLTGPCALPRPDRFTASNEKIVSTISNRSERTEDCTQQGSLGGFSRSLISREIAACGLAILRQPRSDYASAFLCSPCLWLLVRGVPHPHSRRNF